MKAQPTQEPLFPSERYDVQREDRYVVTHHGAVIVQGTHQQCMSKLHEQLASWRIEHEEDYATARQQPYIRRVLVGWALPGEKNFMWSHQQLFADDLTPEPNSGLALLDFLFEAISGDRKRLAGEK